MSAIKLATPSSGSISLSPANTASNFTVTIPAADATMVTTSATQTLTNKTIEGGTVISGTSVASTSGTSIDFTGIPSWVRRVTVMFAGVSTNGSSNVQIQIGTSSGIETSSYLGGAALVVNAGASSAVNNSSGFVQTGAMGATVILHGHFVINLVGSNNWAGCGNMARSDNTQHNFCGGSKTLGGTLDRVRITTVNGTDAFDAGTINILYE